MRLSKSVELFLDCLDKEDIVIFYGKDLCSQTIKFNKSSFLYLDTVEGLSLAIGLSMCTKSRVFVCCTDDSISGDLSIFLQAATSKNKNLFCVVFNSGFHQSTGFQPTLFSNKSAATIFFNIGFTFYNLSSHFKSNFDKQNIINFFRTMKSGPTVIIINIDKGLSDKLVSVYDEQKGLIAFKSFIRGS